MMSLFFQFIYTYIYTPSNQHFKALPVSKINSKTSFLYQLFKDNSNFTVLKPWKVIYLPVFYDFHCYLYFFPYMFIYAFIHLHINILKPSQCLNSIPRQVFCINFSKIIQNSLGKSHARLFVCLLMMSLFFILLWDKVIYLSMFYDCHYYLYLFIFNSLCIYTPSYQHFKAFLLSKFNSETSFLSQLFKEDSNFRVKKPCKVRY